MKKWFIFAALALLTLSACKMENEADNATRPEIYGAGAETDGTEQNPYVPSGRMVRVQAELKNTIGIFYAQTIYEVSWTDEDGNHTEQYTTLLRTYRPSTSTVAYEALIPGQDAQSKEAELTVTWLISVKNESGYEARTEPKSYTVRWQNIDIDPQE